MKSMNNFAPVYIVQRFFLRIFEFFVHWYVDGIRFFWHRCLLIFGRLEQSLALRITMHHLFEPLYKDYSIVGWILGPIFRLGRVLIAGFAYLVLFGFSFAVIALWTALPAFIIVNIFHPLAL